MATILTIQRFIRSVRQGRTPEPVSCTAMAACTQQARDALLEASWTRVGDKESGLPRHNWVQTGFSDRWGASKYCGDYADGYQHGYATAVCYTIRMPADALAGTAAKIASLAIPVRGDRWLADGCNIDVALSASAVPPAWNAPPDDAVTGQLAVTPSNTGSDTSAIVTFDWSAAPKTSLAYLHITLRLTDYLTHRGAWIEGGAMIDGAHIAVTFNREVTPDTETTFDDPPTAPVMIDIPFGFPDMPYKTGAKNPLRELHQIIVKRSELEIVDGFAGFVMGIKDQSRTIIRRDSAFPDQVFQFLINSKYQEPVTVTINWQSSDIVGTPYIWDYGNWGSISITVKAPTNVPAPKPPFSYSSEYSNIFFKVTNNGHVIEACRIGVVWQRIE